MGLIKHYEKIKIAVIDGYVNTKLLNKSVYKKSFLDDEFPNTNNSTHGTVVVSKILDECPEAEITCIEILDNVNRCNIDMFIKALEYVEKQEFHIINISLGCETLVAETKIKLQNICNMICQKGTMIFAAKSNDGVRSFPSDIGSIVKIGSNPNEKEIYSIDIKEKTIMFKRNIVSLIANGIEGVYKGNSFLCPWIVGNFAKYLSENRANTHNIIEEFFLHLIKIRNNLGDKILEGDLEFRRTYIFQGKVPYIKSNMVDYFKPLEIIKFNDINKLYISRKFFETNVSSAINAIIIDGFLCECEQEKKCIRNFILALINQFDKIVMYGNYFNLSERISICENTKKYINSILF